jgi:membrane protein YdbS with pleckstrin-like domain
MSAEPDGPVMSTAYALFLIPEVRMLICSVSIRHDYLRIRQDDDVVGEKADRVDLKFLFVDKPGAMKESAVFLILAHAIVLRLFAASDFQWRSVRYLDVHKTDEPTLE